MAFVAAGLGHNNCCNGFMGRLTTIKVLWRLHGLDEDHKDGFCDHRGRFMM